MQLNDHKLHHQLQKSFAFPKSTMRKDNQYALMMVNLISEFFSNQNILNFDSAELAAMT